MILPNSARRWDVPLKGIDGFGKYTVSATLTYGQKNQTIEMSKTFWIIPTSVMIAAGVSLIVLLALVVGLWLFIRKRHRTPVGFSHGSTMRRR